MKLEDVLPALRNNKQIYREDWLIDNTKFVLCIIDDTIKCKAISDKHTYIYSVNMVDFTLEDLNADDWRVID